MLHRDEYIAKMKVQLDDLNDSMNKLESSAATATNDVQTTYQLEMNKLRTQSQLAVDKLKELRLAGESSWQELVGETEKVRDALISSYHHFKTKI